MMKWRTGCGVLGALLVLAAGPLAAEEPIAIARAAAPITVDGDLSEPGWRRAEAVTTWWETNPGDNVEPKVENVA